MQHAAICDISSDAYAYAYAHNKTNAINDKHTDIDTHKTLSNCKHNTIQMHLLHHAN
jgi:hypothetical protein